MGLFGEICGAIGGAISSIGGALGGFLGSACGLLGTLGAAIGPIGVVISGLSSFLNLSNKDEKIEETGKKMEIASREGILPENYNSIKDYVNDGLSKIKLSEEDIKDMNEHRDEYTVVGAGLRMAQANEALDMNVSPESFVDMTKIGMSGKEVGETLEKFKEKDVEPKIDDAIRGKLGKAETTEIFDILDSSIAGFENKNAIISKLDKMLEEI